MTNLSSLGNYTDQWQLLVFNVLGARFFASGIWIDGFGGNASRNVTTAQLKQRVWGDPPDAQNRSTAVVWYTAMDAHDAQVRVCGVGGGGLGGRLDAHDTQVRVCVVWGVGRGLGGRLEAHGAQVRVCVG